MSGHINAKLVYDGGPDLVIPRELLPSNPDVGNVDLAAEYRWALAKVNAEGKMQGTLGERLTELSSRTCYDSLIGKGRGSDEFHAHIKQVRHTSVWGHYNRTVYIPRQSSGIGFHEAVVGCMNRAGVWCLPSDHGLGTRITVNLRAAAEWHQKTREMVAECPAMLPYVREIETVGNIVRSALSPEAPRVLDLEPWEGQGCYGELVEPETNEEKWVSMYISGSRGLTHELVRHGWRTAMSQRSTRYCDESSSPWVMHPLTREILANPAIQDILPKEYPEVHQRMSPWSLQGTLDHLRRQSQKAYDCLVTVLQGELIKRGVDAFTARKQARGAARGYLGNALFTELIFSASVAQWRRILMQRLNAAADAEIREDASEVLPLLQGSRYGDSFADMRTVPSPDGIGQVLAA